MPDLPCPHCGQLNETQREVCWACCRLLKAAKAPGEKYEIPGSAPAPPLPIPEAPSSGSGIVSRSVSARFTVNGKEYADLDQVPEPFRTSLKKNLAEAREAMKSGKRSRIIVNGAEYARLEDVPQPFRAEIEEGIARSKPAAPAPPPSGISTVKIGPFTFHGFGTYIDEPLGLDPDAPAAVPDGFRLEQNGLERRISWRWFSFSALIGIFFAAVFSVPFAFMFYIYLHSPADKPWPTRDVAVMLLLGLAPAAVAYVWLCYLVNGTTLSVDPARVSVRHGPLPCGGSQEILKADIARVFSEKRMDTRNDGSGGALFEPKTTYRVRLLLKDGTTRNLATGLLAPEQAMYIEQQVRKA